ncbi:MAG: hypothetical protein ACXVDB_00830 [Tumebacillaceae bacterium]
MRKVERKCQKPASLKRARKEKYYEAGKKIRAGKKYEFSGYNEEDVKEALREMFFDKCAYCESMYAHVHALEVEHFRPKGAYQQSRGPGSVKKPGYYWLAWNWNNLFTSCKECNQVRTRLVYGGKKVMVGKGNLFPLSNKTYRALNPSISILQEDPLLLNPCKDDPEEHLEYTEEGVIRAKITPLGIPSIKGETSIDAYALQRDTLVQERKALATRIQAQIKRVESEILNMRAYPGDVWFEERLEVELKELFLFEGPKQSYSMMAKQLIQEFKNRLCSLGIPI